MVLVIFDSSILLRRRESVFGKTIPVPCGEDSGNTAVRNLDLVGIKLGLIRGSANDWPMS